MNATAKRRRYVPNGDTPLATVRAVLLCSKTPPSYQRREKTLIENDIRSLVMALGVVCIGVISLAALFILVVSTTTLFTKGSAAIIVIPIALIAMGCISLFGVTPVAANLARIMFYTPYPARVLFGKMLHSKKLRVAPPILHKLYDGWLIALSQLPDRKLYLLGIEEFAHTIHEFTQIYAIVMKEPNEGERGRRLEELTRNVSGKARLIIPGD